MLTKTKISTLLFIKHFIQDIQSTGAIAPSSRFLARDIARILKTNSPVDDGRPLNILEIGPGTGSLTHHIIKQMDVGDHLDIVEINGKFYDHINRKYGHIQQVNTHHTDFLNFHTDIVYDYIFSSLPYESLPSSKSRSIWKKKLSLCRVGSYISYYKYLNFNHFRCKFEKELVTRYCQNQKLVFRNIPPAKLFTLEIKDHDLLPVEPVVVM